MDDSYELIFMDYVISAFEGFNLDYYVPGSNRCVFLSKDTELDVLHMESELKMQNASTEDKVFNVTGTISKNFPDAVYYCYDIPTQAFDTWKHHYE